MAALYLFSSCNSSTDTSATSDSTTMSDSTSVPTNSSASNDTISNNAGTTMVDDKAITFVKDAAAGGMMEVELGNIAQQKAKSQRVKDFGQMMVNDHSNANKNLKDLASQKNIDIPNTVTKDQEEEINTLSKKSGPDFDHAYVDAMIKDHKEDIVKFKNAQGNVNDNDIKNFIITTLPVLQKHLDSIQAIKSHM